MSQSRIQGCNGMRQEIGLDRYRIRELMEGDILTGHEIQMSRKRKRDIKGFKKMTFWALRMRNGRRLRNVN